MRVAQPRICDPIQRGRRDDPAEGARNAETLSVGQDQEHVGRALGWHDTRWPPGLRVLDTFLDDAAELQLWRRDLFPADGFRGVGGTGRAIDCLGWRW